jgi:hypothetical protein
MDCELSVETIDSLAREIAKYPTNARHSHLQCKMRIVAPQVAASDSHPPSNVAKRITGGFVRSRETCSARSWASLGGPDGFVFNESVDPMGRILRRRCRARPRVLVDSLWDSESARGLVGSRTRSHGTCECNRSRAWCDKLLARRAHLRLHRPDDRLHSSRRRLHPRSDAP